MSELLPCPFCGGEAQFNIYETTCGVECEKCRIGTAFVLIDEYKQAIQAWNTRQERTCRITSEEYDDLLEYTVTRFSCGHSTIGAAAMYNYCPECGAKVVE